MNELTWTHRETDRYLVVGEGRRGTRFSRVYANPYQALAANLRRGRVYLVRHGKRTMVAKIEN